MDWKKPLKLGLAGLVGLESLLCGCALSFRPLSLEIKTAYTSSSRDDLAAVLADERFVAEEQEKLKARIRDPFQGLQYLKKGEYVVPEEVLKATQQVKATQIILAGIYIPSTPTQRMADAFKRKLNRLNLPSAEREAYEVLFSLPHPKIIYNEQIFVDGSFKEVIPHERAHKFAYQSMTPNQHFIMQRIFQELKQRRYNLYDEKDFSRALRDGFPLEEFQSKLQEYEECKSGQTRYESDIRVKFQEIFQGSSQVNCEPVVDLLGSEVRNADFNAMYGSLNYDEFLATLAADGFPERVVSTLSRDYPRAYRIFLQMEEASKLVE